MGRISFFSSSFLHGFYNSAVLQRCLCERDRPGHCKSEQNTVKNKREKATTEHYCELKLTATILGNVK